MKLSNKSLGRGAFTLAEVLITLGIIGVVAAMTMPSLMNSTQGAQYKAAYKKALSALSQAVTLNVALDDYNFAQANSGTDSGSIYAMIYSRMNHVKVATEAVGYTITAEAGSGTTTSPSTATASNYTFFFNDGIVFSFPKAAANCTKDGTIGAFSASCKGFIDVNGEKNPNRLVKCENTGSDGHDDDACTVTSPTDVYPVVFYDQTVLPNSAAARAVLYGK